MPQIDTITFTIDKDEVLKQLHFYPHQMKIDARIEQLIDHGIDEGYILAEAKAVYETFEVVCIKKGYVLQPIDYTIKSTYLQKHLGEIEVASFFVCTIGSGFAEKIEQLLRNKEFTQAAILDAVGGAAIEGVADQVNEMIRRDANIKKYKTKRRFSPGYGDWHIENQKKLLEIIRASSIGISVTDAALMIPEKSISAIVGWYR